MALGWLGCSPKLTEPTALCTRDKPARCRPVAEVERLLVHPALRIVDSEAAGKGKQGSRLLTVELGSGELRQRFRVKWRAQSTWHGLNHPRKEVATYALQQLFLDPQDYVFPPTRSRCFELEHYRKTVDPNAEPTYENVPCVFGTVSYWLADAVGTEKAEDRGWLQAEQVYDAERFARDEAYRRTLADINLLTYVSSNGDTHVAQFMFTETPGGVRVYNIDFTIAYSDHLNQTLEPHEDFSRLQVSALRQKSVERLRRNSERIQELRTAEGLILSGGGLTNIGPFVAPAPSALPDSGLGWLKCDKQAACKKQLVVGLREKEVAIVRRRLNQLFDLVDRKAIDLF